MVEQGKVSATGQSSNAGARISVRAVFDLALAHYRSGRTDLAERLFRDLLAVDPNDLAACTNLGLVLMARGKLTDASVQFHRALELEPELAEAHLSLGNVFRAQGASDQATARYYQALSLKPNIAAVYSNLGGLCLDQNKLDEAIIWFQHALAIKPDLAEAHNNLANLLQSLGRLDDAVKCYCNALAIRPDDPTVHNNLGNLLLAQGRREESIACYRRALALKQVYPDAHIALGTALLQLGRTEEATIVARSAVQLPDSPSFPHYMLGLFLAKCGFREAAQIHFTVCLDRDRTDRQGAGLALARMGLRPLPERAPTALLSRIYSSRAQSWDRGSADYRGADLVARMFARHVGNHGQLDLLDAGSGTGLVGAAIRPWARRLDGVDLSPQMCERARQKNIYDRIEQGDLIDYMRRHPAAYDVVTSAATFIHFGDLRPVLDAAAMTLRDRGLLIFTLLENQGGADTFAVGSLDGLAQGGCYVHGRKYIAELAEQMGFFVAVVESAVHEMRLGQEIMGLIVVLQKLRTRNAADDRAS